MSTMSGAQRSGWLSFASVMMFVAAGFYAVWALNLYADAAWVSNISNGIFGGQRWLWGLWDTAMCVVFVWAGWNLWTRATSGARLIAVIAARSAWCAGSTGSSSHRERRSRSSSSTSS